jgi:hypothetical protein
MDVVDNLIAGMMKRLAELFAAERHEWKATGTRARMSGRKTYGSYCAAVDLSLVLTRDLTHSFKLILNPPIDLPHSELPTLLPSPV